jgi:hypothetical protein
MDIASVGRDGADRIGVSLPSAEFATNSFEPLERIPGHHSSVSTCATSEQITLW